VHEVPCAPALNFCAGLVSTDLDSTLVLCYMKLLIWSVFVVLTLLWTGMAMVTVNVSDWALGLLSDGAALGDQIAALNLPTWVALWVQPEWIAALQTTVVGLFSMVQPWLPSPDTLGSVMAVLVWLTWGVGALVLLTLAIAGHVFSGR
jgi:hypothetical protein